VDINVYRSQWVTMSFNPPSNNPLSCQSTGSNSTTITSMSHVFRDTMASELTFGVEFELAIAFLESHEPLPDPSEKRTIQFTPVNAGYEMAEFSSQTDLARRHTTLCLDRTVNPLVTKRLSTRRLYRLGRIGRLQHHRPKRRLR
jgi:hypothetical protein